MNKNIGGGAVGGPLTTEQKKKLLWGNKKNESAGPEVNSTPLSCCLLCKTYNLSDFLSLCSFALYSFQTVKNWNNLFTDRERQEKFNKLMVSFLSLSFIFFYLVI